MVPMKMVLATWCVLLMYISATRGQFGGQGRSSLSCKEWVKQEILKDQAGPPIADKEYPSCDKAGNYEPKQCYGKWTGVGHCSCVDPMTGTTMTDIKGTTHAKGSSMTCRCALDHSRAIDRASFCDLETGDYKPILCIADKCRCAQRWGAPMTSFAYFNKGYSNCLCARKLGDVIASRLIGRTYRCDLYGRFRPVQCTGSRCYCVNSDGNQVGQSVFISNADGLRC